jgi:hypothetical protein
MSFQDGSFEGGRSQAGRLQGGAPGGAGRPPLEGLHLVRKRDGREVPFDAGKIVSAVQRAMAACGDPDPTFAKDVAAVVELSLSRELRQVGAIGGETPPPPGIERIQDAVEQALMEMGRAQVAKTYILYRDHRARAREALRIRESRAAGATPEALRASLRVRQAEGTAPWSKGRIAAALVAEADLPARTAEEVASRVERTVLEAQLTEVSTGLIRALVDHELVGLGLTDALERIEPVVLPRHDLRQLLQTGECPSWEPWESGSRTGPRGALAGASFEARLSGEALRRMATAEALDPRSADLHLEGDLHVEDLRRPQAYLWAGVPTELAHSGLAGGEGAFALLEALPELFPAVSYGLTLEDTGPLFSELARATRPGSHFGLAAWLRAVAACAAAGRRQVDLTSPGTRFGAARLRLLEELEQLGDLPGAPRLYLDEEELIEMSAASAHQREALQRLLATGRVVLTWSRGSDRFVGPGCRRREGERGLVACGGAVALHLPRLARRVGPWREERFLEELFGLLSCALEACRSLDRFQERAAAARPGGLKPRKSFAFVPVGLGEAVAHLGDGGIDVEQASRVLGVIAEVAARIPEPGAPSVLLSTFFGERAAARLAWLDANPAEGALQPLLFSGLGPSPEAGPRRPYCSGFELRTSSVQPRRTTDGREMAELLRTVPSGALARPLLDPSELRSAPEPNAFDRFQRARLGQLTGTADTLLPLEGAAPAAQRLRLVTDAAPTTDLQPEGAPPPGP